MMEKYISPLRVRIRRAEQKVEKVTARKNAIFKMKNSLARDCKNEIITSTEYEIVSLVQQKILAAIDADLHTAWAQLEQLKQENCEIAYEDEFDKVIDSNVP